METIRINMTPCNEVETIHASQNDTSLRKWGIRPYDYDGNDVTNQQDKATLVDIKGQTLKWNQQVSRTTFPVEHSENGLTIRWKDSSTVNISGTASAVSWIFVSPTTNLPIDNHVYLFTTDNKPSGVRFGIIPTDTFSYYTDDTTYYLYKNRQGLRAINYRLIADTPFDFDAKINMFDLTSIFGETKADEILAMETAQSGSGIAYFKSLFPLDYYSYNAGTLLSFNGTGIKTVNADETEEHTTNLPISTYFPTGMKSAGTVYDELTPSKATTRIGAVTFNGSENWYYDSNNALFICAVANAVITNATTQYNVYTKNNRFEDKSWATRTSVDGSLGMHYGASFIYIKSTQFADVNAIKTWLQSNPVTVYYELATPIETDISPELDLTFNIDKGGTEELLPSSLMNGSVDLGSLTWTYMPNNYFRSSAVISDAKIPSNENTVANIFCSILKSNTANNVYANNEGIAIDGTGRIRIYYDDMPTDVASFTQAMQGVLLWYEKSDSTPTTTPLNATIKYPAETKDVYFTYQVSDFLSTVFKFYLVTKGIQIPCELEDDTLVADCTSEISNEPGFFDCKIKAENDLGQIFSNKFQLHIERSPQ